ncbi:transposase [Streptomyces griseoruber]|uniref:transposase n=1 Tax=Streptomyces griseoruber TaxID=1943 RepID=UPI0037BD2728
MARPAADRAGDAPPAPGGGDRGDLRCSGGTYGSPKVFIELVRRGRRVSVNTVAKVMAELGPAGRKVRRRRSLTRPGRRPAPRISSAGTSPPRNRNSSGQAT